ncbi:monovalent cation/H(+) antiporter subunit G [Kocuria rhizophila]|uniref:monovalent cation/H(+) antiporter subunit G n=1 Tax=Kocuria rhizophila TaxID=72000 RepID=UPI000C87A418|nr:monovalent cation/H(+) antiporter subunit G [Kocuria rhizophila]MCR4526859.1 monovalent cation/H(+) antiporter subunit G [Kocuria rhizophila]MCT1958309.1 monovalent cation/H(+) antiporter subunit G [Kocuria rhizophila]MCT2074255.1 monovalent cation/H(+) antiporter subunit G [Kocuria rhizophila]PMR90817.1 sodium:proton antiporter [Kocuria rhizophila]
MNWHTVTDVAAVVCLVAGTFMSFAAAVGLVRFPDLLSRMHAGTKPQVFGLLLLLTALALASGEPRMIPLLVLAWIFQLLTVPVSAHMVGRAAYRSKHLHEENLVTDELRDVVARAGEDRPD